MFFAVKEPLPFSLGRVVNSLSMDEVLQSVNVHVLSADLREPSLGRRVLNLLYLFFHNHRTLDAATEPEAIVRFCS
jgi:hypothetical protein